MSVRAVRHVQLKVRKARLNDATLKKKMLCSSLRGGWRTLTVED